MTFSSFCFSLFFLVQVYWDLNLWVYFTPITTFQAEENLFYWSNNLQSREMEARKNTTPPNLPHFVLIFGKHDDSDMSSSAWTWWHTCYQCSCRRSCNFSCFQGTRRTLERDCLQKLPHNKDHPQAILGFLHCRGIDVSRFGLTNPFWHVLPRK